MWKDATSLDMSKDGRPSCQKLLADLSAATKALQVRVQSRTYRKDFAGNYWKLFGGTAHCYNFDVLQAAVEWTDRIYVNGQWYDFDQGTGTAADALSLQWNELTEMLRRLAFGGRGMWSGSAPEKQLRKQLQHFDEAWANFEAPYIFGLMRIEEDSRSPIRAAMDEEARLHGLEELAGAGRSASVGTPGLALLATSVQYHEACQGLIRQLGRINAVAHLSSATGTGRDDLGMEVLLAVSTQLDDYGQPKKRAHRQFAEAVAWRAYQSWLQVREYLTTMATMVEHVDPQVSNNTQLVKALAAWENDWASAKKYLLDATFCEGICLFLEDLKDVIASLPCLQRLVDDRD
eukprot:6059128-Amphidinium_carterae.1